MPILRWWEWRYKVHCADRRGEDVSIWGGMAAGKLQLCQKWVMMMTFNDDDDDDGDDALKEYEENVG